MQWNLLYNVPFERGQLKGVVFFCAVFIIYQCRNFRGTKMTPKINGDGVRNLSIWAQLGNIVETRGKLTLLESLV